MSIYQQGTPLEIVNTFIKGFGERPIYYQGRKIGYWKDLSELCQGKFFLYKDWQGPTPPASALVTKDDFWQDIAVTQYCLNKRITPKWYSQRAPAAPGVPGSATPQPLNPVPPQQVIIQPAPPAAPASISIGGLPTGVLAIGAAALVTVVLLARR